MADADVRALLESKHAELESELEGLVQVPRDPMASVSFGKRIGDGTTEAVERLNRTAAAQSLSTSREEVERALAKLDDGTYGVCDDCGEAIAPERLEAIPWTALCVRDASKRSSARA
jgi:DnaK suppressor protein